MQSPAYMWPPVIAFPTPILSFVIPVISWPFLIMALITLPQGPFSFVSLPTMLWVFLEQGLCLTRLGTDACRLTKTPKVLKIIIFFPFSPPFVFIQPAFIEFLLCTLHSGLVLGIQIWIRHICSQSVLLWETEGNQVHWIMYGKHYIIQPFRNYLFSAYHLF